MKAVIKKIFILIPTLLLGCSSQNFNKKMEDPETDLLKEESLMRYNSNRLDLMDVTEKDFISKALLACHQNKFEQGKTDVFEIRCKDVGSLKKIQ